MEKNFVRSIVDSVVKEFREGGPGSGRYPAGSGKNPGDKHSQVSEDSSQKADIATNKAVGRMSYGLHAQASIKHFTAAEMARTAARYDAEIGHQKMGEFHAKEAGKLAKSYEMKSTNAENATAKATASGAAKDHSDAEFTHYKAAYAKKEAGDNEGYEKHIKKSEEHQKIANEKERETAGSSPKKIDPVWGMDMTGLKKIIGRKTFRVPKTKKAKKYNTDMSNDPFSDTE